MRVEPDRVEANWIRQTDDNKESMLIRCVEPGCTTMIHRSLVSTRGPLCGSCQARARKQQQD